MSHIDDQRVELSAIGEMVLETWRSIPDHYDRVDLDHFVVMPSHVHGIIGIDLDPEKDISRLESGFTAGLEMAAGWRPLRRQCSKIEPGAKTPTLGRVVSAFKSITSRRYLRIREGNELATSRSTLWQRNFYDHVIRNATDLQNAQRYVMDNPVHWSTEPNNPEFVARLKYNQELSEREVKGLVEL